MAARTGRAVWNGNLQEGDGELTVGQGAWTGPYSFTSRFEEGSGTNPEELIAAAHAGCFSMALGNILAQAGTQAEQIRTSAKVHLRNIDGLPTINRIELEVEGTVPGIDESAFRQHAEEAKKGCVVSRALGGVQEIEVSARLT